MNDIAFSAELTAAKLIARADGKDIVRRVAFRFALHFDHELAEWLGDDAITMRQLLIDGQLLKFTLPIDAYSAKAAIVGAGNAEALVFGVNAQARMSSDEEPVPMLSLEFEAFPEASLLTFIAASLKATCEVDLKRVQLEMAKAITEAEEEIAPIKRQLDLTGGEARE